MLRRYSRGTLRPGAAVAVVVVVVVVEARLMTLGKAYMWSGGAE